MALNYYFSGSGLPTDDEFTQYVGKLPCRLLSCHGSYFSFAQKWTDTLVELSDPSNVTILLDSGAFTAWNQGHEVTLDDLAPVYWKYMEKYWGKVKEVYMINLDKIPGSPGRTPDAAEIQHCIEVSDENYYQLQKLFGHRVLPVFHQGESEERLQHVCEMGDYVCVSPRNDLGEVHRVKWSREVHSKIPRNIKTHGLAATGTSMMTTVPWYSVDSATYIFIASNGGVIMCLNGKLVTLGASSKNTNRFDQGKHLCNMTEFTMENVILPRLDSLGYTIEQLAEDYGARMMCSMREVQHWVDNCHEFKVLQPNSLFDL